MLGEQSRLDMVTGPNGEIRSFGFLCHNVCFNLVLFLKEFLLWIFEIKRAESEQTFVGNLMWSLDFYPSLLTQSHASVTLELLHFFLKEQLFYTALFRVDVNGPQHLFCHYKSLSLLSKTHLKQLWTTGKKSLEGLCLDRNPPSSILTPPLGSPSYNCIGIYLFFKANNLVNYRNLKYFFIFCFSWYYFFIKLGIFKVYNMIW